MTHDYSDNNTLKFYGRRKARPINKGRQAAMDTLADTYSLPEDVINQGAINPVGLFDHNPDQIWLEVGFGNGEHLAWQAEHNPDVGLIGCEPFINGVAALYKHMDDKELSNIRVWPDDARMVFNALNDATIDRLFLLFPDPWPKTRHHKRRFINATHLDMMARIIKPGGLLRIATDHKELAQWMLDHCIRHSQFEWTARSKNDWQTPPDDWIKTRYQEKAKAGHINWFIECRRLPE